MCAGRRTPPRIVPKLPLSQRCLGRCAKFAIAAALGAFSPEELIMLDTRSPFAAARPQVADAQAEYWVELFGAVLERLGRVTDDHPVLAIGSEPARTVIVECVAALGQLRSTLVHEADRYCSLQREAAAARSNVGVASQGLERRARSRLLQAGGPLRPEPGFFESRLAIALADAAANGETLALQQMELHGLEFVVADHGRETADKVRRILAERLGRLIRAADMVSSTGSNGFAIVLAGLPDRAAAGHLAAKLLNALSPPVKIGALTLSVRASIGIALFPSDANAADSLMQAAASAMQVALERRRGFAFFDDLDGRAASRQQTTTGRDHGLLQDKTRPRPGLQPLSAPGAEADDSTEHHRNGVAMHAAFSGSGGIARSGDLARLLDYFNRGESAALPDLISSGRVFGFELQRTFWVPMFQFDLGDLSLKPGPGIVLAELKEVFNGWELAAWFSRPNSSLNGSRPVDMVDSDLPAVLGAARTDRFVAAG